jgi:hypothetical protein
LKKGGARAPTAENKITQKKTEVQSDKNKLKRGKAQEARQPDYLNI